ncbi:hypothetical protein FJ980_24890 [Mesorhizobium sp. B1-1-5]|nr:hypothetical protein FJ980_24890 [Mesorhizobium sp. B1-1-5]
MKNASRQAWTIICRNRSRPTASAPRSAPGSARRWRRRRLKRQVASGRHRRVPSRPPLSCRTSPPLGGRSDAAPDFANHERCRTSAVGEAANLPQVGEMSGRTEGGAVPSARPTSWYPVIGCATPRRRRRRFAACRRYRWPRRASRRRF